MEATCIPSICKQDIKMNVSMKDNCGDTITTTGEYETTLIVFEIYEREISMILSPEKLQEFITLLQARHKEITN